MLIKLFLTFAKIGFFSFGGGLVALGLIEEEIVNNYHWITVGEFRDLVTIAQMTPGPIAINAATFVGTNIAGLPGGIVATFGAITPAMFIVSGLTFIYYRYRDMSVIKAILNGLKSAVVALIASAGLTIFKVSIPNSNNIFDVDIISITLFILTIIMIKHFKVKQITTMVVLGVFGTILFSII